MKFTIKYYNMNIGETRHWVKKFISAMIMIPAARSHCPEANAEDAAALMLNTAY